MASNVAVETDAAGNVKPSKKKSTERIDGIVATVMALGRTMCYDPPQVDIWVV
jgi:phage terminase large subunit-like protein